METEISEEFLNDFLTSQSEASVCERTCVCVCVWEMYLYFRLFINTKININQTSLSCLVALKRVAAGGRCQPLHLRRPDSSLCVCACSQWGLSTDQDAGSERESKLSSALLWRTVATKS